MAGRPQDRRIRHFADGHMGSGHDAGVGAAARAWLLPAAIRRDGANLSAVYRCA